MLTSRSSLRILDRRFLSVFLCRNQHLDWTWCKYEAQSSKYIVITYWNLRCNLQSNVTGVAVIITQTFNIWEDFCSEKAASIESVDFSVQNACYDIRQTIVQEWIADSWFLPLPAVKTCNGDLTSKTCTCSSYTTSRQERGHQRLRRPPDLPEGWFSHDRLASYCLQMFRPVEHSNGPSSAWSALKVLTFFEKLEIDGL